VTTQATVTSQMIAVEHIRISSEWRFAEVRRNLESAVPKLDTGIAEALRGGDQKRVKDYEDNGPKLSIFAERYRMSAGQTCCPQARQYKFPVLDKFERQHLNNKFRYLIARR
jgi:hypothetical protein